MSVTNEKRHLVYSYLLHECLGLFSVPYATIKRLRGRLPIGILHGCAEVPGTVKKLIAAHELSKLADLAGIPGFYFQNDLWRLHLPYESGFLIPYLNDQLLILGFRIYKNLGDEKYTLLTSRGLPSGARAIPCREKAFV